MTAAGVRTIGLINAFKEFGYSIKFLSIKKPNPSQIKWILDTQTEHHFCPINDENAFKSLVSDENLCIFETANIEQMFGHMVNTHLPDCKRILDTQDLHFLRKSREKLVHTKSIDEIKNIKTD